MHRRTVLAWPAGLALGATLAPAARAADAAITIDNFSFTPAVLTVGAGTTVTWTNHDDIPHVVADKDRPREIKSPVLDTDESYSRTFTAAGTYGYFCTLHPHMQGTVVVR